MTNDEIVHTAIRNIAECYGCKDMTDLSGILFAMASTYLFQEGSTEASGEATAIVHGDKCDINFTVSIEKVNT